LQPKAVRGTKKDRTEAERAITSRDCEPYRTCQLQPLLLLVAILLQ
jgi:hypothetical protein